MRNNDVLKEEKPVWEKPVIETKEIFEKTALACDGSAFLNSKLNNKASATSCGYYFS